MEPTPTTTDELFLPRIVRLEASAAETSRQISELTTAVRSLTAEFQAARRPQWQTWIAASGVLITLAVGGFSIVMLANKSQIAPLEQRSAANLVRLDDQSRRIDRAQDAGGETAQRVTAVDNRVTQQLAEVETQFRALSMVMGLEHSEHDRLLRVLWKRTFGDELPDSTPTPMIGREQ